VSKLHTVRKITQSEKTLIKALKDPIFIGLLF